MGINKYFDNSGKPLFLVSINLRSRRNRKIRVKKETQGIESLAEAQREERRLKKIAEDALIDKEIHGATLSVLIKRWASHLKRTRVKSGEIGEKVVVDAEGTLRKWLEPYLGEVATNLTSYRLQEVVRKMRMKELSDSHLQKFKRWVTELYNFGIHMEALPSGTKIPVIEIRFKNSETVPEILNHTDILRLMNLAVEQSHPWRHVWGSALLTGMRSGELYALEWTDIQFEHRIIRVSRSYQVLTKTMKSTKAGYWRDVPISDELMRTLLELKNTRGTERFVFPRFPAWGSGSQAEVLRSFCVRHGLPSIKFHTLRACFATQLLRNGVEAAKVMKVCGWRDLSTMQRYIRLAGIEIAGVTDKISVYPSAASNNLVQLKANL